MFCFRVADKDLFYLTTVIFRDEKNTVTVIKKPERTDYSILAYIYGPIHYWEA